MNNLNVTSSPVNARAQSFNKMAEICAGLLRLDLKFIAPWYALLALPALWIALTQPQEKIAAVVIGGTKLLSWIFAFEVYNRFFQRLKTKSSSLPFSSLFLYLCFCITQSLCVFSPLITQIIPVPPPIQLLAMIMVIPGLFVAIRYYYFFLPIMLGIRNFREILVTARLMTIGDPALPLRVLVPALGLSSLLEELPMMIYPDGRSTSLVMISMLFSPVFPILIAYLDLASVLTFLPDSVWRRFGLDPYREGRLATIAVNSNGMVASTLLPSNGIKLFAVAILIALINLTIVQTKAPSPKIAVLAVQLDDPYIIVTASLTDQEFMFSGFNPSAFNLAGESGKAISVEPDKIEIDGKSLEKDEKLGRNNRFTLKLYFKSKEELSEIVKLKDLYLWYRSYRVALLAINQLSDANSSPPPLQL